MTWKINWLENARKQLRKLDKASQAKILNYMRVRVASAAHPSDFGKPLRHEKYGLWRYRVGDNRVICQIQDEALTVLVVQVGHRKKVYH